jgi:hypothetical protein
MTDHQFRAQQVQRERERAEQAKQARIAAGAALEDLWAGPGGQALRDLIARERAHTAQGIVGARPTEAPTELAWGRGYYAALAWLEQEIERSIKAAREERDKQAFQASEETARNEQALREYHGGKPMGPGL